MVIKANYDIVHLSEHSSRFLQFAGAPSLNLLQVVHPALRAELRTALFRATHQHSNVTTSSFLFETEAGPRPIILHIRPTRGTETERFFLVVFELLSEAVEAAMPPPTPPTSDGAMRLLEEENQHLRQQLNATIEQYEASLEELKAANEEQQSVNEETRSTAEELETSKEELQSTNEELTTVNQELKNNLNDLSRANGDLQNLMASTEIGTIFLDRQLGIQRFTPRIRELFNIIPTDLGRPLTDITHKLNYQHFIEDAEQVLETLVRVEREVQSNKRFFLARLLPYRTVDDHIDGVVLTFIDITERKEAEDAVRHSEEQLRRSIEDAPIPIIMHAEDGRVLQISRTWTELTGYTLEEMAFFHTWLNTAYGEGADAIRAYMQQLFTGQERRLNTDFPIRTRNGETRFWSFSASAPGMLRDGQRFIVGMALDITERKQAEEALRERQTEIERLNARLRRAMTETHHRVKNNLQLIAALIDMQTNTGAETVPISELVRLGRNVQALSLIHDILTQEAKGDGDALLVSVKGVLNRFLPLLQATLGEQRLRSQVQDLRLPVRQVTSLTLIANELIANAVKHGKGEVELNVSLEGNRVTLEVSDNGSGFDADFDSKTAGHTGLELIDNIVRHDLQGEISYRKGPKGGAHVMITFQVPDAKLL